MQNYSGELNKIANFLLTGQDGEEDQAQQEEQAQDSVDNQDQQPEDTQGDQPSQDEQQPQDDQGQEEQQQEQPQDDSFEQQITQVITDLAKQVNNLKTDISKMQDTVLDRSKLESADKNTNVLGAKNYMKKDAFLKIMDELSDVADAFVRIDPRISKRIDNIMDSLRFYDKV